jgi:hypothetical protein
MLSELKSLFRGKNRPESRLHAIAAGPTGSVQQLLADAAVRLRTEAYKHRWANWDSPFEDLINLVLQYLCDDPRTAMHPALAQQLRENLETVRSAGRTGALYGQHGFSELDQAATWILHWCESRPQPITLDVGWRNE